MTPKHLLTLATLFLLTSQVGFSQTTTFNWFVVASPAATQQQTVDGITATYDAAGTTLVSDPWSGGKQYVFAQSPSVTSATVTFSQAVNLNSVVAADFNRTGNWTFTPTGGSNTAVTQSVAQTSHTTINLNWTGITGFTVTAAHGSSNFAVT